MKKGKLFLFLYLLVLGIFIISGTAFAVRLVQLRRGNDFYAQTQIEDTPYQRMPGKSAVTPDIVITAPDLSEEPEGESTPDLQKKDERSLRLTQFAKKYPDAVLWLQLEGTALDYPVMRGTDNQYYLNRLPDGSKNTLGSLFLDYRTNEDSKHLIIYGHNGSGGKMFGMLKQYESYDFFLEHPMLTVVTKDAVYFCPIFSVRRIAADSDAYQLEFANDDGLGDYIYQAAKQSLYPIDPDVDMENAKRVLTLSTCTGWRAQRLIVQALWM